MARPTKGKTTVFYAYPSTPPSVHESIENAARELGSSGIIKSAGVRFRLWPSLAIGGRRLTTEITQTIDKAHVFACDLTHGNPNVAFELGYAIAKFKRIWISLNTTIERASRDYKALYGGLLGAGFRGYENYNNLADAFLNDAPWQTPDGGLLGEHFQRPGLRPERPALLYARPELDTDAVIETQEFLAQSIFSSYLTLDNPRENPSPTIEWYAEKLRTVDAALVHLLGDNQRGAWDHNIRASFVAGMAHGFNRHLRLQAHTPFTPPTDYEQLLKQHDTAEECVEQVRTWAGSLPISPRRSRRREDDREQAGKLELRNIAMGEPVAENEDQSLDEYFLETTAYYDALASQLSIFLGRRGTGKSANMIALSTTLTADRRNHVCTIKPVGYEVDGLIRLLKEDLHKAESGFLIESLWKFLIYAELATSVADEITGRPVHMLPTEDESKFLAYMERHSEVLGLPFSQRVNRAVSSLVGIAGSADADFQRTKISELLHGREIQELRELLGTVLASKAKVVILIDRLDEPWGPAQEVQHLADLLSGLLRVGGNIIDDFRAASRWRTSVRVSITIFIRSDVFSHVQPLAVEQDKLPIRRITWTDPELLMKVINQRLVHAADKFSAETIWRELFVPEVAGLPTQQWILLHCMPRPRDVIYFVKEAIATAVNRSHEVVEAEDLLDAREKYSQYVFLSVLAEDSPQRGKLEEVLFEFAGAPRTMTMNDVKARINKAGAEVGDVDFYIDLLCDINFLGIQTRGSFKFSSDETDRRMLRSVAARLGSASEAGEKFQINPAFYQALQID